MFLLNQEQRRAVDSTSRRIAVIAPAGSGKTRVLIDRICRLVQDDLVNPANIKAITFTRKAAGEMKLRLEQNGITVSNAETFHGFCLNLINRFATRLGYSYPVNAYDETLANTVLVDIMIAHDVPNSTKKNAELRTASNKKIKNAINKVMEKFPDQWLRIIYEYNARLKGYNAVDYQMMIHEMNRLLRENGDVRDSIKNEITHLMIDEFQDTNPEQMELVNLIDPENLFVIGDIDQCVDSETIVSSPFGDKKIKDFRKGDTIYGFRNGMISSQLISEFKKSSWTEGVEITTESGKKLLMSPNHKIWADLPVLQNTQHIVYLMYRSDLGFRIGKTNKCITKSGNCNFGQRARHEHADRLWVVKITENNESALYWEEYYSLLFGIPTYVFNAKGRGINEERVNKIFLNFGNNGFAFLDYLELKFAYPHWSAEGQSGGGTSRDRHIVNVVSNNANGSTRVSVEWTGDKFDNLLSTSEYHVELNDRRRIRKWFASYTGALNYARYLSWTIGALIKERLSTKDGMIRLMTASSLHVGMKVIVKHKSNIKLETIASVRKGVHGNFYDIQVDDCANFFGNDILSHNSIYGFRNARPENIADVLKVEGTELIQLKTNYRCAEDIVKYSNNLISKIKNPLRTDAIARKDAPRGICEFFPSGGSTWELAATKARDFLIDGYSLNDIVILCRDNGNSWHPVGCYGVAEALKRNNIPFKKISREASFWEEKIIRNMIYTINVILNPLDRGSWGMAVDFPEKRVSKKDRLLIREHSIEYECSHTEASMRFKRCQEWAESVLELNKKFVDGGFEFEQNCIVFFDEVVEKMKWTEHFSPLIGRTFPLKLNRIKGRMRILGDEGRPHITDFIEWWLSRESVDENPLLKAIEISTIHSYKGLEKPVVIIPGLDEDYFPRNHADTDVDEEVRVLYVAITRAEDACVILHGAEPSRFVDWTFVVDGEAIIDEDEDEFL